MNQDEMMPPHIVARLVAGEKTMSESHSAVTILFSDIVGWTHIASALPTAGVVRLLDHVFGIFDGLTAQHGVFKVETIGDAYMVAAGHAGEKDHAARCVRFGLAMLAACRATPAELLPGGLRLQIRVGVHTGPASVSFFCSLSLVSYSSCPCSWYLFFPQLPTNNYFFIIRIQLFFLHFQTGVVGSKVPRFCFFGDTVNVASRM